MTYFKLNTKITRMQQQDKKILKRLGRRIKKLREEQKYSLNEFALGKGITPATLSRIENELVDVKFITLVKVSNAFQIPLGEILTGLDLQYDLD
ncbi:MAG: helix-turn-helix transcriptional regulator [Candidatus Gastranaerophilales bacterium]|nr:helix-turn-helix transcriptional regulator [Candidatus Gastranaerophilales bacterium]